MKENYKPRRPLGEAPLTKKTSYPVSVSHNAITTHDLPKHLQENRQEFFDLGCICLEVK